MKRLTGSLRQAYLWLEDKPMVIVLAAAGATVGVALVLRQRPAGRVCCGWCAPGTRGPGWRFAWSASWPRMAATS